MNRDFAVRFWKALPPPRPLHEVSMDGQVVGYCDDIQVESVEFTPAPPAESDEVRVLSIAPVRIQFKAEGLQMYPLSDEQLAKFSAGSPFGFEELRRTFSINGVPCKSPSPMLPEPWTPPWERGPAGNRAERRRRR